MLQVYDWATNILNKSIHYLKSKPAWHTTIGQDMDFCPFIHPIISTLAQKVIGAEVLLRFLDDEGRYHSPERFIKEFKSTEYINDITIRLMDNIRTHFQCIIGRLPKNFFFSFNICASQLDDPALVAAAYRFNNTFNMVFEIVEHSVQPFSDQALKTTIEMVNEGILFAIDDFGAGHSSLTHLENMGVIFLKLDRHLTSMHEGELVYRKTISALVDLSHSLNITIIAKGVENRRQEELLTQQGVELMQGYHYCQPLMVSDFIKNYL